MHKTDRVDEFVTLYTQHAVRLRGFLRALVPHQSDSEDLYQEVARTLWAKFDTYQSGTNFLGWAMSIARFKVLEYRRQKARLPINMSDTVFDLIAEEVMNSANQEDVSLCYLNDCLQSLPARDRELISSRYRHGQSTKTLALALRQSVDAVYRSLRRIHRSLLMCIQQRAANERGL
jgi:RNA polymerase sigma-70 factor (ECF subfamily)